MRDILDTLKSEHDELRALFQQLNALSDDRGRERREMLDRIENVLVPHAKWEEMVFYPAFEERADHEQQLLYAMAMQEHRAVEQSVLPDLHAADIDGRQFAGSARVLSELIDHHAREEEQQMFAAVRQVFSADELSDFDGQYEEWKESGMAGAIGLHAKLKTGAMSMLRSPSSPG